MEETTTKKATSGDAAIGFEKTNTIRTVSCGDTGFKSDLARRQALILLLRLGIAALSVLACVFWRTAAWRAKLETKLTNLEVAA
jgi:hypothetical protein